jgi:tetratricopeptide (TPR) repeat protein
MEATTVSVALALKQHQEGRLLEAQQSYRQLLLFDSKEALAWQGLGAIAYHQGCFDEAIDALRQALELQPNNCLLLSNLGAAYRATGRLAEAETCYRQALRLRPDFAEASNNLGNVLKEQGRLDEATARYELAFLAKPQYAEAHNNLGLAFKAQGKWKDSAAQFQVAAQVRPDWAEPHFNWGLLDRDQGRPEEATQHLLTALNLQPGLAQAHHALGLILYSQERLGEAAAHFETALRSQPDLAEAHHYLGLTWQRLGQIDMAEQHFQHALRLRMAQTQASTPHLPERRESGQAEVLKQSGLGSPQSEQTPTSVLFPQALALMRQGRLDEAATALQEVLGLQPEFAEAHHQLALVLHRQGQPDEANAHGLEAVRLDPDNAEAYLTLGKIQLKLSRLDEALLSFFQALRAKPDLPQAAMHVGAVLREQGYLSRSAAYLRYALHLRPDLAEAHDKLGQTLYELGEWEEAAVAYQEALIQVPNSVSALSHLGSLLEDLGQPEEGRCLLQQALDLGPEEFQTQIHFGTSLVNQGRFEEAKAHFLQALTLRPDCAAVYFLLARDSGYQFSDKERGHIQEMLQRDSLPLRNRISLHFALAHVLDRERNFEKAFLHCDHANFHKRELLRRQGHAFQSEAHQQFIDRLISLFDKSFFQRVASFGSPSVLPVFVVGMPRSGTTLVEQILASHPAVFGAGEIRQMKNFVAKLPSELGSPEDYPECLSSLEGPRARRLAESYLLELSRLGGGKARVTDKVPMNFHNLGLIATLLPKAQIIHCRRDPRDVCWSCYFQNFREVPFACELQVLGAYYRQYERLMAHWKRILPMPIFEVCYEELVEDPERISREMLGFCGLPWDGACLAYYETPRMVRTASNRQVRQPVYKHARGHWKNFESHLSPLLNELYPD